MKIAIYSDNFYPEISGISDSIITIAKELSKRGHKVIFYVPKYSKKDFTILKLKFQEINLGKNIQIFRLPSLPYPLSPTKQGRLVLPFLFSFKHIKKFNPDVIYTQSFFGAGIEALLVSKILKIHLVGTNHTLISEFLKYSPIRSKLIEKLMLKYVSWYYNHCQYVTSPSKSVLKDMEKYGFKRKNRFFSNPIDLSYFKPTDKMTKKRIRQKLNLSGKIICYAGRLAEEKNVDQIIKAIKIVKEKFLDVKLMIAGKGKNEEYLKQYVKKLGLEQNVYFLGYLKQDSLLNLYRLSDIFAVMSTAETQCMSMMQAMASGLPVIGADAWAIPEYLNGSHGIVVPAGDVKSLAEKIIYLFNNQEKMEKLEQEGVRYVKNFSVIKIANEWEKTFNKIINGSMFGLKLSIVIPAYNEEKNIKKCLKSILKNNNIQKYNLEIIVVNNNSLDKTGDIASQFSGVKVINEKRKGIVWARQAGYLASKGNLIANIDADNIMPDNWLSKVFYEFGNNPQLFALSGPYVYRELAKWQNFLIKLYYFLGKIICLFTRYVFNFGAMLQGGNYIVKREALERIGGYNTSIKFYGEDTDIARRISSIGRVKFSFSLIMFSSNRRLAEEGIVKSAFRYGINYIWTLFTKKPFSKAYNDIRK